MYQSYGPHVSKLSCKKKKHFYLQRSKPNPKRPTESPSRSTAMEREDEEWELCNDDGFVFKREKRSRISDPGETSNPANPELDPAAEERNRRMRKKRTLAKLRSKYRSEIQQWEALSNRFNAALFRTTLGEEERLNANEAASFHDGSSSASVFIDEHLSMVISVFFSLPIRLKTVSLRFKLAVHV